MGGLIVRDALYETLALYDLVTVHTQLTITNKPTFKVGSVLYQAEECSKAAGYEFARRALPHLYKLKKRPHQADMAAAAALFSLGIEGGFLTNDPSVFWALPVRGNPWWIKKTHEDYVKIIGPKMGVNSADFLMAYFVFKRDFASWLLDEYGINLETNLIRVEAGQVFSQPKIKVQRI